MGKLFWTTALVVMLGSGSAFADCARELRSLDALGQLPAQVAADVQRAKQATSERECMAAASSARAKLADAHRQDTTGAVPSPNQRSGSSSDRRR